MYICCFVCKESGRAAPPVDAAAGAQPSHTHAAQTHSCTASKTLYSFILLCVKHAYYAIYRLLLTVDKFETAIPYFC